MLVPANAEEYNNGAGEFLGNLEDVSGYIVPDDENGNSRAIDDPAYDFIDEGVGRTYQLLFSITAGRVTNLLHSGAGNKSFSTASLPSEVTYLMCRGTLYHSKYEETPSSEDLIRGGICYYGYNHIYHENEFISVASVTAEHGSVARVDCSATVLVDDRTYYSFVKNLYTYYDDGYVYGNWSLYYSVD